MPTPFESLFDYTGKLMVHSGKDTHAVYIAYFPTEMGLFVKVGLSAAPIRRLWGVHCNSTFPLDTFSWAWVGRADVVRVMEKHAQYKFIVERTRGEWFRFDRTIADVDQEFRRDFDRINGRKALDWHKGDLEMVRAYASLESGNKVKAGKLKAKSASTLDTRSKKRRMWSHA